MKIYLQILDCYCIYAEKAVEKLTTKELVPKMVLRRRLTRSSKLVIELLSKMNVSNERIIFGSAFGELQSTSKVLNAILSKEPISPTDFQNSVYNTAVSYASILLSNENEITTVSSGDTTSLKVIKAGAIKAIDGDEIILVCSEVLDIENIEDINHCVNYLESAVAMRIKMTRRKTPNIKFQNPRNEEKFPKSIEHMVEIAKQFRFEDENIIEVEL